jgi:tetratricopeptide (TPR) repeat protein
LLADTSSGIQIVPLHPAPIIVTSFNKRNAAAMCDRRSFALIHKRPRQFAGIHKHPQYDALGTGGPAMSAPRSPTSRAEEPPCRKKRYLHRGLEEPMSSAPEPTGTLEAALAQTRRLLKTDPRLAAEQAKEILEVVPQHPIAILLLGIALRAAGETAPALKSFEQLVVDQPSSAAAHFELGITLGAMGQHDRALAELRRAVALKPDFADAWRAIGDQLTLCEDAPGADAAYAQQIKASTKDPRLLSAAAALCANRIPEAEVRLREHLKSHPTDVAAIRMFAEVAGRVGRFKDAELLLARCLELAPSFNAARHNYALALHRQNRSAAALQQIDMLSASEPENPGYRNLKAVVLSKIGEFQESIEIYADVLKRIPNQGKIWMSYGHALASSGAEDAAIAAYRRCVELQPGFGEAYWSLANLKTFRFTAEELMVMRAQLGRGDLADDDRLHFHFAMGKALEDDADYPSAFEEYLSGNRLRRAGITYDAAEASADVQRSKRLFTASYFYARAGFGAGASDPIFIVGLPRAGSTLIEQILASHSAVEGTMELPDILAIAQSLKSRKTDSGKAQYPAVLGDLTAEECGELGRQYIAQTRIQRKTDKPFFVDKMPNNFWHIGLIRQILPNAKIIDARRHPLACGLSGFKQHFARGQHYTYDLAELGRYYRDYVELLAHFDTVLPGRIHRVVYEEMIEETEAEVRRLLSFCGLPFEDSCLRFYENDRAVRTASKQQVRQPIFREGVDHWRHFEQWLAPLKETLGPVLDSYPSAPAFPYPP